MLRCLEKIRGPRCSAGRNTCGGGAAPGDHALLIVMGKRQSAQRTVCPKSRHPLQRNRLRVHHTVRCNSKCNTSALPSCAPLPDRHLDEHVRLDLKGRGDPLQVLLRCRGQAVPCRGRGLCCSGRPSCSLLQVGTTLNFLRFGSGSFRLCCHAVLPWAAAHDSIVAHTQLSFPIIFEIIFSTRNPLRCNGFPSSDEIFLREAVKKCLTYPVHRAYYGHATVHRSAGPPAS